MSEEEKEIAPPPLQGEYIQALRRPLPPFDLDEMAEHVKKLAIEIWGRNIFEHEDGDDPLA